MYIFPVINYVQAYMTFKGQCFISMKSKALYWTYHTTSTANFLGRKDYINLEHLLSKPKISNKKITGCQNLQFVQEIL